MISHFFDDRVEWIWCRALSAHVFKSTVDRMGIIQEIATSDGGYNESKYAVSFDLVSIKVKIFKHDIH